MEKEHFFKETQELHALLRGIKGLVDGADETSTSIVTLATMGMVKVEEMWECMPIN